MRVRATSDDPGRLVRVQLAEVPERQRALKARFLREQRWKRELRPDYGYMPTMAQRLSALSEAVALERAVIAPSNRYYLVPEKNVRDVLG